MLYFVFALCIVCSVDAKAFQSNDGSYNGEYDHMYLSQYPEKHQPPPNDPNYELRYIPHIDGQPIFIPPIESVHYQTAIPISSHRRKMRPKYDNAKYFDYMTSEKKLLEHKDTDSEFPSGLNAPERTLTKKPYEQESKRKQIKKPTGVYNQKLHTADKIKYSNDQKKGLKQDKVIETKGGYPIQVTKYVDVPIVHSKSMSEQDYDLPLIENVHKSQKKYENHQSLEKLDEFMNDQGEYEGEYEYDNPEVVDAALNSKQDIESGFDEYEQIQVAPLTNPHQSDYEISDLENQHNYDSSFKVDALKNKNNEQKYSPSKKTLLKHSNNDGLKMKKQPLGYHENPVSVKRHNSESYDSSVVIKNEEKKNSHKTQTIIKAPVKFPSVHMSDYAYEIGKKTFPEAIKKPVKNSETVIKKPHIFQTGDKNLKYEDSSVKQESQKKIKKPNVYSKLAEQKPIKRDHVDSDLNDNFAENELDNPEYDTPVSIINESIEDFEYPSVVESLVKKEPINKDDYSDYDSPKVVEAVVKKEQIEDDYSDYDTPNVVEALTKKKPSKKNNYKDVNSNEKIENENVKQKVVKGNSKIEHKKPDMYVDYNLDKDSKVIELHHQREGPVFFDLNKDKETTSEDLSQANHLENSNEKEPLDDGSGLNNGRSRHFEDARGMFLKSNVWSLVSNFHSQERNKFKRCKTPNNEPGNCMPIQMCPVPNLDLTLDDFMKKVCTIDTVFIGICCPEFPAETLKVKWDNLTESSVDIREKTIESIECGEMKESVDNLHSWPWMTPLISVSTRRIFCGGVLIKDQYVLTAAHCTRKIPHNQILAILGPMSSKQDPTNQEFAVVEIKRHAQYNPRTMQNDIALLKLSKPVILNELRRFICLPKEEANFIGEEALLLGWQGSFEASKNEESLRVISPEVCRKGVKTVIGPNVLCTEPRTEDIMCNLDSGAPLIVKEDGKFVVIGVLSWNRNDCDADFPAIFTRVSHFRKWIDNHAI